jgi:hypothetical protein
LLGFDLKRFERKRNRFVRARDAKAGLYAICLPRRRPGTETTRLPIGAAVDPFALWSQLSHNGARRRLAGRTLSGGFMLDVVNSVVEKVGITPDQADGALRIIINFLHADGPSETVASMAQELGIAHYIGEATPRGGLLGALGGLLGSGGGAMAAFGQLQSLGLNFGQIQAVVRHLIDIGRSKIGNEEVDRIVAAIPGLSQIV